MADARLKLAETIFDAAVDLPRADREVLLTEWCGDDVALRALVEGLLANHDSGLGSFLSPSAAPAVDDEPDGIALPVRIGPYEILARIAEGGMGTVYEARQESPRRVVALKVIRPASIGLSARKRFHFEVEVLGQLRHVGIVQIYEAGEAQTSWGAQPYFAMERIHGRSLMDHVDHRGLGARDRLELLAKVCDAVHYAHEKGVLHRDLKPGNILVEESSGSGRPKILDFGVARALCSDLHLVTTQTQAGQIIGTLAYMSPEQVRGRMEDLDGRSDVYSLGVVMYELLAGRLPYELTDLSVLEAGRVIQEEEPLRISRIDPAYRGDVETILEKALEKEKERRYPSAAALADDIRRYLEGQPITARPASALYRLRKAGKRNRTLLVAAAWMAVAGVGAGLLWRANLRPPSPIPSLESSARRLTATIGGNWQASCAISPDGERLTYRDGPGRFLVQQISTGDARPLPLPDGRERSYVEWLPDGAHVLSYETGGGPEGLWRVSIESEDRQPITEGKVDHPSVSPDGKHLAFLRNGFSELWICEGDGEGERRILSAGSGVYLLSPVWGPGGKRIAYLRYGIDFRGTLETCDVGGEVVAVLDERRLPASTDPRLCWLPDGRLIYPSVSFPDFRTVEMRVIEVDPKTGTPKSEPRRLMGWDASRLAKPSASSDGRRLVFSRKQGTSDVYILEVDEAGIAVGSARRLTQDDWRDGVPCWSPDGRQMFFESYRSGNVDILVQGVEDRDALLFVSGPSQDFPACVAPHSSELLFWRALDSEGTMWDLMKTPTTGGVAERLLSAPERHKVRCGTASRCVLGERIGRDLVFRAVDLGGGPGDEIARLALDEEFLHGGYSWDLSRDGSRVIVVARSGQVQILDLESGRVEDSQWEQRRIQRVAWSGDGSRVVVTGMDDPQDPYWIKSIDLEGHKQLLWRTDESWLSDPSISPDGRFVAFVVSRVDEDVWMIEGF